MYWLNDLSQRRQRDSTRRPRHKQQILTSSKINRARAWERQPANLYNNVKKRGALRSAWQLCLVKGEKPRGTWRDTEGLREGGERWRELEGEEGDGIWDKSGEGGNKISDSKLVSFRHWQPGWKLCEETGCYAETSQRTHNSFYKRAPYETSEPWYFPFCITAILQTDEFSRFWELGTFNRKIISDFCFSIWKLLIGELIGND